MQTIMIRIALMLCLMECAIAFNIPIQKEIDGQEDEGKNIIARALVSNRCAAEYHTCVPNDPNSCCKGQGLVCKKSERIEGHFSCHGHASP